jgi:hypothetical protein
MKYLLLMCLLASPAAAQVTPNFTQGSMQSTTTTTIDIDRTIATEIYGGAYSSWSGTNVTAGDQFQLELVTRAAGVVESIDVDETIQQVSTTTSLSIFSQ